MTNGIPHLDEVLTLEQCAEWLRMKPRDLHAKCKGKWAPIPAMNAGAKSVRFHPRTVLAKMASDAGVPIDVIAASYGIRKEERPISSSE